MATRAAHCPICRGHKLEYLFAIEKQPIAQCVACGFVCAHPQPQIAAIAAHTHTSTTPHRANTARLYLEELESYLGRKPKDILLVGDGDHHVEGAVKAIGCAVETLQYGPDFLSTLRQMTQRNNKFDSCLLIYSLDRMMDPSAILKGISALLKRDGALLIVTPSLDSWSARLLGGQWPEFTPDRSSYFNYNTIRNLLYKTNYQKVRILAEKRLTTLKSIDSRLIHNRSRMALAVRVLNALLPKGLSERELTLAASGMLVLATPGEEKKTKMLSVVMPVYNEKRTFSAAMAALTKKQIPGLNIEIIVVESNSTDGTREDVLSFQGHPRVTLIFQEKARGKGNALRAGFKHMKGDLVLIQDADLEYDLNDYESLVGPLLNNEASFVIGSRHSHNGWKIREFNEAHHLSTIYNFGHVFFLFLLNTLYHQKLNDPFSMFKVFYRDCLDGLEFECDRFDFDFELVIKLLLKGCRPLEIPVNYKSRSNEEGKKVRMFLDPLTWLRALVRYRFRPVLPRTPKGQGP